MDAHCRAPSCPRRFPTILGEDRETGCFAMAYLPPDAAPGMEGIAPGRHRRSRRRPPPSATCARPDSRRDRGPPRHRRRGFPTDDIFHAIRLEPYLVATARAHPDLAPRLDALVEDDAAHEAGARPRRLQPEEPADRPRGTGDPRCRVRLVRRPGVRPRVRAEPPAAEGRVAAAMARALRSPRTRRS